MNSLKYDDPQLAELIQLEAERIENTIDLVVFRRVEFFYKITVYVIYNNMLKIPGNI